MAGALTPALVLASSSPRRRELLALLGLSFTVAPADVDETLRPGEPPHAYVERLAREKARKVAKGEAITIGCDTTVVVDGDVLAKPEDPKDATRMLRLLSGRSHLVLTAVAVVQGEEIRADVVSVGVTFRALRDDEIAEYIATGEPMDKAGAYGIQGYGATIVDAVDGDYFAVMGLPLNRLVRLIEALGYRYRFGQPGLSRAAAR